MIGPYSIEHPPYKHYFASPLMTVEKKGNPGKFRVVHHLSYPRGKSINSFVKDWPCSLTRFAQALRLVCALGKGCYMAKIDIKAAYRLIPIRTDDWPLLGMCWNNQLYFHTTLPFGLKSSCHLWERYATAAEWIVKHHFKINNIIHYVDDTFTAEKGRDECQHNLNQIQTAFNLLGLTIATEKTVSPTTKLVFLGVQIDSEEMSISMDSSKLSDTIKLLTQWSVRATCSQKQLQSLIGRLSWAANVVAHGRTFIQSLRFTEHDHLHITNYEDESMIIINEEAHDDIIWWLTFVQHWNGVSLLWEQHWLSDDDQLQPHTDACNEGYGAVCGRQWFHSKWNTEQQAMSEVGTISRGSMPWKELYALVTAAATWGHRWSRKRITFRTDCEPVVLALKKGASRSRSMMQLIRFLHYHAAKHHFEYRVVHIPGVENSIADELSRVFCVSQLSQQCLNSIDPSPTTPVLPTIPLSSTTHNSS